MNRYAVVCLLLLCVSSIVSARDVRMHGANGDGGACTEPAPAATAAAQTATRQAPGMLLHSKVKTPPLFRGGDDDIGPHTPRWHSFLPGMFR